MPPRKEVTLKVSLRPQTADQQWQFEAALEALLTEWVRQQAKSKASPSDKGEENELRPTP